jgi:ribonuclease HI
MPQLIDEVQLYTDGGCRGNPGPGAIGMVIMDAEQHELLVCAECIGPATNNRAEYRALIKGLDLCAAYTRRRVVCYSDSELLVSQMTGAYRLKNEELRALWQRAKELELVFQEVVDRHVRRTDQFITKADRLLNEAFDGPKPPGKIREF